MTDAPKHNTDQRKKDAQDDIARTRANRERPPPKEGPAADRGQSAQGTEDHKRWDFPPREKHRNGNGEGFEHFKKTIEESNSENRGGVPEKLRHLKDTLDNKPNAGRSDRNPDPTPKNSKSGGISDRKLDTPKNRAASTDKLNAADIKTPGDRHSQDIAVRLAKGLTGGAEQRDNARMPNSKDKKDGRSAIDAPIAQLSTDSANSDQDQKQEKKRIATPTDGIGHAHGSADANPVAVQRWGDANLSKDKLQALKERRAHLELTGHASRDGKERANERLSEARGSNTGDAFSAQYGIPRDRILNQGVGESKAKAEGHPDGKDDADDRVTDVKFVLDREAPKPDDNTKGDVDAAVKAAREALPPTEKDRNSQEQWKMASGALKNFVKDTAKEALKNPAGAEEFAMKNLVKQSGKFGVQELRWAATKLAQDLGDKKMLENIQAQAVPGMKDALSDFGGVKREPHAHADSNNLYYKLAYNAYSDRLYKLADRDAKNLKTVLRSDEQRRAFEYQLDKNWTDFGSRGTFQH